MTKFTAHKDKSGKAIAGLWESEICRVERVEELWAAQVPLRRIGASYYYEYHPSASGGAWQSIGSYRTRKSAMHNAELLVAGNHVWEPAIRIVDGEAMPARMVLFKDVVDEIRDSQK